MVKYLLFFTVLSLLGSYCLGDYIYIDVNNPNGPPGDGSQEDPFVTIQDAIDVAHDGDILMVAEGVYTGPGNQDLDFGNGLPPDQTRAITVQSHDPNDPQVVKNTIIDPEGLGRGFYFYKFEQADSVVLGLTIRNGYTGDKGGAIACFESSPSIERCQLINNSAGIHGGAIYGLNSDVIIKRCVIYGNSAVLDGGGLELSAGNPRIDNCLIYDNQSPSGRGGAIDCVNHCNLILTNCTLAGNQASSGGALCLLRSDAELVNNIFWDDQASQGPEISLLPENSTTSTASVSYCNVKGGQSSVYQGTDCILNWGSGNLQEDPCFVLFDIMGDPSLWDLHLQSAYGRWDPDTQTWESDPVTSLCIDAGDPAYSLIAEPWPHGKRINMGAYGGTEQASMNGNPADFDVNGQVDWSDFVDLADKWLEGGEYIEDLTKNGTVDMDDLIIFADNWLWKRVE